MSQGTRNEGNQNTIFRFLHNMLAVSLIAHCIITVVENHRKSLILQHCERSEQSLHFEWTKVHSKMPKMNNGTFL